MAPSAISSASPLRFWRWPLIAAGTTLLIAAVGLFILFRLNSGSGPIDRRSPPELIETYSTSGRAALVAGEYHRAATELSAVERLLREAPSVLSSAERRRMGRERQVASLLADLVSESPVEILRHAIGMPDAEWQDAFRSRYAGRSILLDDTVRREVDGGYRLDSRMSVLGAEARFDLKNLRRLQELPLHQPQRLLFGFRFASVGRAADGAWIISADPDSCVFIVDPAHLAGTSLVVDADLKEVIQRQAQWINEGR